MIHNLSASKLHAQSTLLTSLNMIKTASGENLQILQEIAGKGIGMVATKKLYPGIFPSDDGGVATKLQ